MAVESATYISQLVDTNPVVGDPVGEGDDHLRMIKEVLKTNFSGINSSGTTAVTSSAAELNVLDGIPGTLTATELGYVDGVTSAIQTQINAKGVGDAVLANDQSWTGSQRATAVTDNDGSFDMNAGQTFICTPAGNFALTFTNITNGQSGFIKLINSGGHTVSLHANSKGDANLATTVSTAGTYLLSYFSDGTDVWLTNSAIYA